jgi:hypothetical protein
MKARLDILIPQILMTAARFNRVGRRVQPENKSQAARIGGESSGLTDIPESDSGARG